MDMFSIFLNLKVCCLFSLESPHQGDSHEYTHNTIFNIKQETWKFHENQVFQQLQQLKILYQGR